MVRQMIKSSSIPLLILLALPLIVVVGCGGAADVPEQPKPAVVTDAPAGKGAAAVEEPAKQTTAQKQPSAAEAARIPGFSTKAPTPAPVEAAPSQVQPWKAYVSQGKYGGALMIGDSSQPDQWDLHKACCNFSPSGARDIYNNLVYYDPLNQVDIIGDLAESWEWAGDGLSITFRIHANATWSDGVSVTADDVKYSLDRIRTIAKSGSSSVEPGDGLRWAEGAAFGSQGHGHLGRKPSLEAQGVQCRVDQGGECLAQTGSAQGVNVLIPAAVLHMMLGSQCSSGRGTA